MFYEAIGQAVCWLGGLALLTGGADLALRAFIRVYDAAREK